VRFHFEKYLPRVIQMTLRLVELHGLYPLFVMCDSCAPKVNAGQVCTVSWQWLNETVVATVVCEGRAAEEGFFFRIPGAKDVEGARGIAGPALAAILFSKNDAMAEIHNFRVMPSDDASEDARASSEKFDECSVLDLRDSYASTHAIS
jgi:hypothetical protein